MIRFKGLLAPTEVPTGDGRMFQAGKMTHRPLPIPLMAKFGSGGHDGAVSVGIINRIFEGPGGYHCEGEFLDPTIVPEVVRAAYLLSKKAMGPSVDLDRDYTVKAVQHPTRPDKKAGLFEEYNVIGATLVPMPAFHQVHLSVETADERALLASAGVDEAMLLDSFDINPDSWRSWPIAPRDYKFDADDAVKRIAYWAGIGSKEPNLDAYASTFLWRNGNQAGDTMAQDSFRLPLADIINGEPHLVYHAVYAAAALLSGAHGGVPMIPDSDKNAMVPVINEIYANLASAFNDERLKSPFLVGVRPDEMAVEAAEWALDSGDCGCDNREEPVSDLQGDSPQNGAVEMAQTVTVMSGGETYNITGPDTTTVANVSVTFTPADLPLDVLRSMQQEKRPWGDDGCHFDADGFCTTHFNNPMKPYGDVAYADPGYQSDGKHRYPIDRPSHIRAAWSYINMPRNADKYTSEQLDLIKSRIREAAKKHDITIAEDGPDESDRKPMSSEIMVSLNAQSEHAASLLAGAAPLAPPAAWFTTPSLAGPTKLTITDDGHVFGHLAQWRVCHVGIGNACVMAPHSKTNYNLFHVGTLICDDGSQVPVGKITLGTGHANAQWGVMPSREHYDNTGWAAAVVTVGEDRHGIWVNGSLTSTMTPERIAEFRAAALSGDWREVNGNLELIAALAVNNPGFPVYRESNGRAFSLMAVGVLGADEEISGEFSVDDTANTEEVLDSAPVDDKAALVQRLESIDADRAADLRKRRFAQLAALDEARDKVSAPRSRSQFRFDQQYDAKFDLIEEQDDEE